jgi:hypothetical protein
MRSLALRDDEWLRLVDDFRSIPFYNLEIPSLVVQVCYTLVVYQLWL